MEIDYGYITGWVATLVIIPLLPLIILSISYLRTINHQLADIKHILSLAFPTETNKSKNDYSRDSYLKKLFPRGIKMRVKMKSKLIGISLVVISSLSAGYMFGGVINTYLPDILVKMSLLLVMLSSGIYLVVRNRRYISDVL